MDVVLTENQSMLHDATRRFVQASSPITQVRTLSDGGFAFPGDGWKNCAQQGWIGLLVPQAHGGMAEDAEGVIDAAIVAEELGRVVFAGPFLPNAVAAFAITQAGSESHRAAHLPELAEGNANAAWCYASGGPSSGLEPDGLRATRTETGFRLNGLAGFVENAAGADLLLVTAADEDGLSQFLVPAANKGVTIEPLRSLDLGRTFANVHFDNADIAEGSLMGLRGEAAPEFERQLQVAIVLQCAETIGLVDRALEFTLEWVRQRYAFGRPIGSFQALKHRLADHTAHFEAAKAAVAHAARAVEHAAPDAAVAISVAKSHCGKHGVEIIRDCVQMHGGIGLTWEHDLHFYLRRAVTNQSMLGTPAQHHERLARLAGL